MSFTQLVEEILPFLFFLKISRKLNTRSKLPEILRECEFQEYRHLSVPQLDQRLAEEHERAVALDVKTLQFTLFQSGAFTILGLGLAAASSSNALLTRLTSSPSTPSWLMFLFLISVFHFFLGSCVALGALRTHPRYGFGTQYLLMTQKPDSVTVRAESLARQETLNKVRHCRNEAVFQTVRNGLLLLILSILVSVITVYIG